MNILYTSDFITNHLYIRHNLPGLAIELHGVKDSHRLEMGEIVRFDVENGYLCAEIFNPGGRVILKRFEYNKLLKLKPLTRTQKIIKYLFDMVGLGVNSDVILDSKELTLYIKDTIENIEEDFVKVVKDLGRLP